MNDSEYVLVMTTLPADADARGFGHSLVDARLAACVNLLPPMESIYRWEGRVEREQERQLLIKTSRDRLLPLWESACASSTSDIPNSSSCIVDGNAVYLRWVGIRRG
jgi:periplasmic divalent cation tolerance protein